jgi:hypothetical protein
MRRRERRLRLVDELEEFIACRVGGERRREQTDDEEDEEDEQGDDAERTPAEADDRLPPRTAAAHARVDELETDRGVDVRFQRTPRFDLMRRP